MMEFNVLYDRAIDAFRKLLYPEEWIEIDSVLNKSELFTLLQVERNGEIIMSQIADYINIPMSTATGLVERLVTKGYLERVRSESDRRTVTIRLTDKGKILTADIRNSAMHFINMITEQLTDDEEELLIKLFFRITDVLNRSKPAPVADNGEVMKRIEIE